MADTINGGFITKPVASAAAISAYLLVDLHSDGTVRPYVQSSGRLCLGSTDVDSNSGYTKVRMVATEGSRYLKLDHSLTIATAGVFKHGATAGTIAPATGSDVVIGHCIGAGATSAADAHAVVECILYPWAGWGDSSFPAT
jgi:hypothetical protein